MKASDLFDYPSTMPFGEFFDPDARPWEWVPQIKVALKGFTFEGGLDRSRVPAGFSIEGDVWLAPDVKLPPYGVIQGPCWIGSGTEIRPGAYIRGNVIVGSGCVLGNSCEFKNCLLLGGVQVPHFNYVGDSILGNKAHLGAGVICANLRLDHEPVPVQLPDGRRENSGLRKLGTLFGDQAEAGCNSVLQPGAILGRRSVVVSMAFSGYLPPDMIVHETAPRRLTPRRRQ